MNDTATQSGAAPSRTPTLDPDVDSSVEVELQANPRNAALEAMAERQESARLEEIQTAVDNDPGLAQTQAAINGEIAAANAEAGIVHEDPVPSYGSNDGAQSVQPMHRDVPATPAALPANIADDPLADFIVMNGAVPMVKAKVNGEERLIPLSDAKRQVQIGLSSEIRMQNAANTEKALDARDRKLSAGESALAARLRTVPTQPAVPAPSQAGLSDGDLLEEATDIFNTAFSGTEEDAAKKLANTLVKIRNSAVATPTQPIDENAIASRAAEAAYGRLSKEARKKDVAKGYASFKTNYPEIMADAKLYRMADDMTDQIELEHPDWNIAQVMDEAGTRTRGWVRSLTGQTADTGGDPPPTPPPGTDNAAVTLDQTNRLERKTGLVRMPSPAGAAIHTEPVDAGEGGEQSPHDAFMELKQSRGQPV